MDTCQRREFDWMYTMVDTGSRETDEHSSKVELGEGAYDRLKDLRG